MTVQLRKVDSRPGPFGSLDRPLGRSATKVSAGARHLQGGIRDIVVADHIEPAQIGRVVPAAPGAGSTVDSIASPASLAVSNSLVI